jgi:hypothetical protein
MDIINYVNQHKVHLGCSEIHGVGLFASTKIYEGELIYRNDLEKEIIQFEIFDLLSHGANADIIEQLKMSRCRDNDVLFIRQPNFVAFSDYINHSKNSNCKLVGKDWIATEEIAKSQEILFNYKSLDIEYKKDF